ncbi:terminase small subunit [Candidatus Omnitrophota bacterium]
MDQKLTLKQRKFIKLYLETGNACKAAALAGYKSYHSGYENLKNHQIFAFFLQLMDGMGIDDKTILQALKEGLASENLGIRHRYLETAIKLKYSYLFKKEDSTEEDKSSNESLLMKLVREANENNSAERLRSSELRPTSNLEKYQVK